MQPYGITVRAQPFTADVPGYGRLRLENLVATVRGRSERRIVVVAHRDALPIGPGANDNASGTAALIVLARSYATPLDEEDERQGPAHTIDFLSSDGGSLGGLGAAHYAADRRARTSTRSISLDAIAGTGRPRLELAGDRPRSPGWTLVHTAVAPDHRADRTAARAAEALRQLVDLALPAQPLRAGAVRRPRHLGGHDHHERRAAARPRAGHGAAHRAAASGWASSDAPRRR